MNGIGPEHHTAEGENLHPAGGGKHPEVCFISTYVLKKKGGDTLRSLLWNDSYFRKKNRLEKEEIRGRETNVKVNAMLQGRNEDSQN